MAVSDLTVRVTGDAGFTQLFDVVLVEVVVE